MTGDSFPQQISIILPDRGSAERFVHSFPEECAPGLRMRPDGLRRSLGFGDTAYLVDIAIAFTTGVTSSLAATAILSVLRRASEGRATGDHAGAEERSSRDAPAARLRIESIEVDLADDEMALEALRAYLESKTPPG